MGGAATLAIVEAAEEVEDPSGESAEPSGAANRSLGTVWLLLQPAAIPVAFLLTIIRMPALPPGGPFSRWEVFTWWDFVLWIVVVDLVLAGVLALYGASRQVQSRQAASAIGMLACALPAFLVAYGGIWWQATCPQLVVRPGLLDPVPAEVEVVDGRQENIRGAWHQASIYVRPDGRTVKDASDLLFDYYRSEGWDLERSSTPGFASGGSGEWGLTISPTDDGLIRLTVGESNGTTNCD